MDTSRQLGIIESRIADLKQLSVGISRALRKGGGPGPGTTLTRSLVCLFVSHGYGRGGNAAKAAATLYPNEATTIAEVLTDPGAWLARAAVSPATVTYPGWASELAQNGALGMVPLVAPTSTYAALASRGMRLAFDTDGSIRLPSRASQPEIGGVFITEGTGIPVKQLSLTSATVFPKKLAVISLFSGELQRRSVPLIEAVIRQGMSEDTADAIDAVLLGDAAFTLAAPAGLRNGVTPIPATAGGGLAALAGDLGNLAAAIPASADLVYLMPDAERVRALTLAPGLASVPIIAAPALPPKTVLAMDAADFVSAEGDEPAFDISSETVVVADDGTPLPAFGSDPTLSLWQQNLIGLRLIADVSWTMRRGGRVQTVENVTW